MSETSLHAALKEWYLLPGDLTEQTVAGFVVDIVRGDRLIEIQTGHFTNLRQKLACLAPKYGVTVVYPIPVERYIVRIDNVEGRVLTRRKSPKRAQRHEIFKEIVHILPVLRQAVVEFELLEVRDEVIFVNDGQRRSWRRKTWRLADRKLLEVVGRVSLRGIEDFVTCIPSNVPEVFTSRTLALVGGLSPSLAQKMLYSLYHLGLIDRTGKAGRAWLYRVK